MEASKLAFQALMCLPEGAHVQEMERVLQAAAGAQSEAKPRHYTILYDLIYNIYICRMLIYSIQIVYNANMHLFILSFFIVYSV